MSQIKIYGLKEILDPIKAKLSDVIHSCVVDALDFPEDKRFHPLLSTRPIRFLLSCRTHDNVYNYRD